MSESSSGIDQMKEQTSQLFEYAEARIKMFAAWYRTKKRRKQYSSLIIRLLALCFVFVGSLCPLIALASFTRDVANIGYVFLAGGAGLILVDRVFGLSTSWMRFMIAAQELEAIRDALIVDCRIADVAMISGETESTIIKRKLEIIKRSVEAANGIVTKETMAWVAEFQKNISHLEQLAKQAQPNHISFNQGNS